MINTAKKGKRTYRNSSVLLQLTGKVEKEIRSATIGTGVREPKREVSIANTEHGLNSSSSIVGEPERIETIQNLTYGKSSLLQLVRDSAWNSAEYRNDSVLLTLVGKPEQTGCQENAKSTVSQLQQNKQLGAGTSLFGTPPTEPKVKKPLLKEKSLPIAVEKPPTKRKRRRQQRQQSRAQTTQKHGQQKQEQQKHRQRKQEQQKQEQQKHEEKREAVQTMAEAMSAGGLPIPTIPVGGQRVTAVDPDCDDIDFERSIKLNLASQLPLKQLRKAAYTGDYWHKLIILRGAGYSKLELMHALVDTVSPHLLAPVMFRREGSAVTFLARNCLPALEQLFANNLQIKVTVPMPMGVKVQPLEVELVLRHTYVQDLRLHLHDHLSACIARRHDKVLRAIDLSNFHNDPELSEVVFWALWQPKGFTYVLNLARPRFNTVRIVNLSNNEISRVQPLAALLHVQVLDLSCNQIPSVSSLKPLTGLNLEELMIDKNPLCSLYNDEVTYIRDVKELFHGLKVLDGVRLPGRLRLACWRRNYLPPGRRECVALADQFLQHYFTLMDGDDRQRLRGMYHPEACFSLTCNYMPGQSTSSSARLTRYTLESRNLLKLSDYSKSQQLLNQGAEAVLAALCRLPRSEHDPYSFSVDIPYYTLDTAMIVVNGVFREPATGNLVRGFSRTFLLQKVASKEYQIVNEMLTVSNATTQQVESSFQYPRPKVPLAKLSFNPAQDLTDSDRQQMTRILARLTEMNQPWARKCLEESKWDIKEALLVFTEMVKSNKLPSEAFAQEGESLLTDKK